MKKLLILFVAALCAITTWAHDFQVNGICYDYIKDKSNEVEVTYSGYSAYSSDDTYSGSVVIPSTVTYNGMTYRVTRIGEYAFQEDDNLTSVTIPNSVTSIVDRAFYECTSLSSVTIPSSVTSIGDRAFYECSSLTSVVIPNGVTSIGEYTFYNCSSLTSVVIPNGVTSIGNYAFEYCSSLTSLTIPSSVSTFGSYPFSGCDIKSITLTANSVEEFCASKINNLLSNFSVPRKLVIAGQEVTALVIPNSVTKIGDWAFQNYSSLTSVTIPENVTSIGDYAFKNCSSLTSVTIPNSVTSLGTGAFRDCSSLTSITIPESVTSIGLGATFQNCTSLKSVQWNAIRCKIDKNQDGSYYPPFYNLKSIENFVFGNYVTFIPECLCSGLSGVTSITIPNSVTSIGDEAFYDCSSLTSITIPESVTSIGEGSTFQNCTSLKSVQWNAIHCKIDKKSNGSYYPPFYYLKSIENFVFGNNVNFIPECLCYGLSGITSITIPSSVTSIGEYAFYDCSSLTSITIPEGVTSIGNRAFSNCSSLTSVVIPNGVTSIGEYAFSDCSSLTSITIPNSVTTIGYSAFKECRALTSVTIPNTVTSIGSLAFSGCDIKSITLTANSVEAYCTSKVNGLLSRFYVPRKLVIAGQEVTELVIPEGVTSIGTYAFCNCSSLVSVTIPEGVTNIGYDAFKDCSSLTSVTIPSSVTSIGEGAFGNYYIKSITLTANSVEAYCASKINSLLSKLSAPRKLVIAGKEVTELVIPEGVTSIGKSAFYNCTSLASVSIPESVTSVEQSAFNGCDLKRIIISTNSVEAYCTSGIVKLLSSYAIPRKLLVAGTEITDLVIPESVTSIEDNAFYGCTSLASVSIHNGVTRIGEGAFSGCDIKNITLSANSVEAYCTSTIVKLLSSYAIPRKLLVAGTEITDLVIPNSVTSIEDYAFCGCSSLRSVTLHNSVTHIGKGAFYECLSLASVNLPKSLKSMGDDIFKGCVMTKGNFVNRSYWDVDNLNYWGASIVDEEIDGLLIKEGAIVDCRPWATSVTIPEGVAVLRGTVFDGCDALQSITCKALIPLQWEAGSFFCPPTDNTMLYVPAEAIELYKNTYPWRNFYDNIQAYTE